MAKKNKGFFTRSMNDEDAVEEKDMLEEQYMKMFPKMGRDFVHREDLEQLLQELLFFLAPLKAISLRLDNVNAHQRALMYKGLLEQNKNGNEVFKDLINMDEENE